MSTVSPKYSHVIPPPIVRRVAAEKIQDKVQTATRICEWCDESISEKALKCPLCQKWRRDIVDDFHKMKNNLFLSILCLIAILMMFFAVFPNSPFSEHPWGYPWHEKVSSKERYTYLAPNLSNPNQYYKTPLSPLVLAVSEGDWQFSMKKFLSSVTGWILICEIIGCIWVSNSYIHNRNDLKRKTGLYWLD
ncbi:MAG: hypothetical protein C0412_09300 [Flavobacterium sp.]|nr:hypothetical protein [Flavobacterium sp.]